MTEIQVSPAGLTLYPSHAFLGASSDGWVIDSSMPKENQHGILEVKCPYSLSGRNITNEEVHELAGQAGFCLEHSERGPRLRRDHKYYAQVQGEMAIMGTTWADFVEWTDAKQSNCFIERICFDAKFVSEMMPKLVEFFVKHILPFYVKK